MARADCPELCKGLERPAPVYGFFGAKSGIANEKSVSARGLRDFYLAGHAGIAWRAISFLDRESNDQA